MILTRPNPILQQVSKVVTPRTVGSISGGLTGLIWQMIEVLAAQGPAGVGLAAVQIGELQRVFVACLGPDSIAKVFINPIITEQSYEPDEIEMLMEGCMSVPGVFVPVRRSLRIRISYQGLWDLTLGTRRVEDFEGFDARIIQHEYDHLNGILLGGQL